MAYQIIESSIVSQGIADTSSTAMVPLGTIVRAKDPTYGVGEFIYLKGVSGTAVGSLVTYSDDFATALSAATANKAQPMAVAMSANGANSYGWYQIGGIAVAAKSSATSFAAGAAVGAGSGVVAATASGKEILGAIVAAVASAASGRTTVKLVINRPHGQGRVS